MAIATMRNASIPSRSVTTSICSIALPLYVFVGPSDAVSELRSENQFAVLRQAQAVLTAVVLDDQLAAFTEQLGAHNPSARERWHKLLIRRRFILPTRFHRQMITILITTVKCTRTGHARKIGTAHEHNPIRLRARRIAALGARRVTDG